MGRKRKLRHWAWVEDGGVIRMTRGNRERWWGKVIQTVTAHTLEEAEAKVEAIQMEIARDKFGAQ